MLVDEGTGGGLFDAVLDGYCLQHPELVRCQEVAVTGALYRFKVTMPSKKTPSTYGVLAMGGEVMAEDKAKPRYRWQALITCCTKSGLAVASPPVLVGGGGAHTPSGMTYR